MVALQFGNALSWYAFLALVPLIILYLIRPKPTKLKVPSLMFFMKQSKSSTAQSLFRYFQRDLLFLIQLLVLLLLAFSITQPSLVVNRDVVSKNIVFIIDVSASSQVKELSDKTRLDIAKEKIKELATSRNSLILLKSSPVIALQDVSKSELFRYLDRLESTDDSSDVAAAIALAGELLAETDGRVVVASDFIESKGVNADVAKNFIESRGIPVDFLDTKGEVRKNIGFVNMVISGEDVNLYIRNFNGEAADIQVKVNNEINEINLAANSVEPFVFTLNSNITDVEILNEDDFNVDNKVKLIRPYSDSIRVLYITNKPSRFLRAVLNSIEDIELTVAEPPIVPTDDFDVYVIADVNKNALVTGTFLDILKKVEDGKSAIVVSQRDSSNVDYEGLLPFELNNLTSGGQIVVNQISRFTRDIDFGSVTNIFKVVNDTGVVVASVGNSSLISIHSVGNGSVVYYGIIESESGFKLNPGYPIFWNNLIYSLVGKGDLNEVNLRTGVTFDLGNQSKTLDKAGIYQLNGKSLSVNLLNEKESDINFEDTGSTARFIDGTLETIKSDVDYRLDTYLVMLALLLILFEFIFIKVRGEI